MPRDDGTDAQGVHGDYSVLYLGPAESRYCEPGRTMFVATEYAADPHGLILYAGSVVKWDPPHENEPVDQETRYRIISNIQEYFARIGWDIIVDTRRGREDFLTPKWDEIRRKSWRVRGR